MSKSKNDCVWLALHAPDLSRAQVARLNLNALRSFELRGNGASVEFFDVADEATAEMRRFRADFIAALTGAATSGESS